MADAQPSHKSGSAIPEAQPAQSAKRRRGERRWRGEFDKWKNSLRLRCSWHCRPHEEFQPLLVLATYRSGSNLLVDYLNSVRVECFGEVLCPTLPIAPVGRRYSRRRALKHIRMSLQSLDAPVRGCKLMLDQLHRARIGLDDLLGVYPNARFVVLYRQSLAEQFLSDQAARVSQQWVLRPGVEPRRPTLHVERDQLVAYCDRVRDYYASLLRCSQLAGRSVLFSYEELTADPDYWFRERICPLVEHLPGSPATVLRKQNPQPMRERVSNYAEVEELLNSPACRQQYRLPGHESASRSGGAGEGDRDPQRQPGTGAAGVAG